MNEQRRKSIQEIADKIKEAHEKIESIISDLEDIKSDEQDYLDNIPENLQGSERYSIAEEAIDNLDSAIAELNSTDFDDTIGYLQRVIEN